MMRKRGGEEGGRKRNREGGSGKGGIDRQARLEHFVCFNFIDFFRSQRLHSIVS